MSLLDAARLDLASGFASFQRALRSRVERRDALLDIVRAVNTTLEPSEIAELDRRTRRDLGAGALLGARRRPICPGQLVGACRSRASSPDMGPAVSQRRRLGHAARRGLRHRRLRADAAHLGPSRRRRWSRFRSVAAAAGRRARSASIRMPSAREPRLTPAMLRAVRVLLEPAAVALDNALLLKRAEALSVTDDLTHLYNSRYLNQVLRRETKRASRSGRPLSLLFIDLDGFKSINDTHGHLSGSRALVEAAAVIRGSARETDVVARFGGDEFALVLPDTGGEGACAVGERIRERIAAARVSGRRRPATFA